MFATTRGAVLDELPHFDSPNEDGNDERFHSQPRRDDNDAGHKGPRQRLNVDEARIGCGILHLMICVFVAERDRLLDIQLHAHQVLTEAGAFLPGGDHDPPRLRDGDPRLRTGIKMTDARD